jgi:hypothetical protein
VAATPTVPSPPAATEFSLRTIGLEMRQAVSTVSSRMIPTTEGGLIINGDLGRRGDPDHDAHFPHVLHGGIRRDRDRGLAK